MKFYRYETVQYAVIGDDGEYTDSHLPNPKLELRTYDLLRETPKGYWIGGRLNVGGTGQDRLAVADRKPNQGPLHAQDRLVQAVESAAQPQAQIRGDLVVARSARVQAPRQRADSLSQRRLEVHVDIFERRVPLDGSGLHLTAQPFQAVHEHSHFIVREETGSPPSLDVGDRPGNVVRRKRAVKSDRAGEISHPFVSRALEPTTPEPHVSSSVAPLRPWYRVRKDGGARPRAR